jgi:hypothetical protein
MSRPSSTNFFYSKSGAAGTVFWLRIEKPFPAMVNQEEIHRRGLYLQAGQKGPDARHPKSRGARRTWRVR